MPHIKAWRLIVVIATPLAFPTLIPRISVDSSNVYDPKYPSPVSFLITNNSFYPIEDVQPALEACILGYGLEQVRLNCPKERGKLVFTPWFTKELKSDEKYQITLEDMLAMENSSKQITQADVIISIEFTPWPIPSFLWRRTKKFRFTSHLRSDGKVYWEATPLKK